MKTYIHYGRVGTEVNKAEFNDELFNPVKNGIFTKPFGGYWASPIDTDLGWKEWCMVEGFMECDDMNSFQFTLKDNAMVLVIDSRKCLIGLPTTTNILKTHDYGFVMLDFEKLSELYDAIEYVYNYETKQVLYGWDCDSLLVMNPDIIIPVNQ